MPDLAVAIISPDLDARTMLQSAVTATAVASTRVVLADFPISTSDTSLRRVIEARPDVALVDLSRDAAPGLKAIELIHATLPETQIYAVGQLTNPQLIVSCMRAGAKEYLDFPVNTSALLESFARLTSTRRKRAAHNERGKTFAVVNAKGGCGATTVAVNMAISMAQMGNSTALVDLATLGHAALHLNVRPSFSVLDAVNNAHRLDQSLLDSFMTRGEKDVHLLAGVEDPAALSLDPTSIAQVLDLLMSQYRVVVVDLSNRLDTVTETVCDLAQRVILVAHTDVASLWGANRVKSFLERSTDGKKVELVLNRFRKISGFSESDAEALTRAKLIARIPNEWVLVAGSIDRGVPVSEQNHSAIARSFTSLASLLTTGESPERQRGFSLFRN